MMEEREAPTLLFGFDDEGGEVVLESFDGEVVTADRFASRDVRRLHIGSRVRDVAIPRTGDALLDRVTIDARNPYVSTDGVCLLSADGSTLIRCLARVKRYRTPEGCRRIAEEAFAYNTALEELELAEGTEEVGRRAFTGSRLREIALPETLRAIGDEAFARCQALRSADLPEGLERIGNGAFSGCSALRRIEIPASARRLGDSVFKGCRLTAAGEEPTLAISPQNARYFIDAAGVLYRRGERGLTLIEALAGIAGAYTACPGTVRVERHAFANRRELTAVELPEGVEEICDEAFLECRRLAGASLPSTVRRIGDKAFFHTSLARLRIPASLEAVGDLALLPYAKTIVHQANMASAVHAFHIGSGLMVSTSATTRRSDLRTPPRGAGEGAGDGRGQGQEAFVEVDPGNRRFSIERGFLCEDTGTDGGVRAIQYVADGEVVSVPPEASSVCAYALYGASRVCELHLHDGIREVGKQGLMVTRPLERLVLHLSGSDGGDVVLYPALNSYGIFAQNQAFAEGTPNYGRLIDLCDGSLARMHVSPERTRRMIARLGNGRRISGEMRAEFENAIHGELDETVARFARAGDSGGIAALVRLGFIDGENIVHAIEVANAAGGVAVTHLLLEERRGRFGSSLDDLDL